MIEAVEFSESPGGEAMGRVARKAFERRENREVDAGKRVRDDVLHLVGLLRASTDPFTIAQWLRTPLVEAGDRTPLELLDAGQNALAENFAKRNASRWSA